MPLLTAGKTVEELASALAPGDDSLLALLSLLGLSPSIALSRSGLSPAERELCLTLRFAPRV